MATVDIPQNGTANITGITALMNTQNIKGDIDLKRTEDIIMGTDMLYNQEDQVSYDQDEFNNLAKSFGLTLTENGDIVVNEDIKKAQQIHTETITPAVTKPIEKQPDFGFDLNLDDFQINDLSAPQNNGLSAPQNNFVSQPQFDNFMESNNSGPSGAFPHDNADGLFVKTPAINVEYIEPAAPKLRNVQMTDQFPEAKKSDMSRYTQEQQKQQEINAVLGKQSYETSHAIKYEREEEDKLSKIERIDSLLEILEEDGVDTSSFVKPTIESTPQEINHALKLLSAKNSRNRYSSLAEEILLSGAEAIEYVFNGNREIPVVGWKPDYTGYHNTMQVKLRRMRHETSTVVGNIIQKYNIGPISSLLLELLPSFFLYPKVNSRRRNVGQSTLFSASKKDYSNIRAIDEQGRI
jgi:hypothetical protein